MRTHGFRSETIVEVGTGSVHDSRPDKYPSTAEFASGEFENASLVNRGRMSRRPSGSARGAAHGFHGVNCTCGHHPCTCNTSDALRILNSEQCGIRRDNVNE
jgi:hypothetical protein